MSTNGIVRRLDELGRIVIPKELRRTLRLNVGDEIEIVSSKEYLVLRKFSSINIIGDEAKSIAKMLSSSTGADVLMISCGEVKICEGDNRRKFLGQKLNPSAFKHVESRKESILHADEISNFFESVPCEYCYAVCMPIISNSDLIGSVVLLLNTLPSDIARAYLGFCTELLSTIIK